MRAGRDPREVSDSVDNLSVDLRLTGTIATIGRSAIATPYPGSVQWSLATQRTMLVFWLLVTDAAALAVAFGLAYWIRFDLQFTVAPEIASDPDAYQRLTALLIPVWLLVFAVFNLYDTHAKLGGIVESSSTFNACALATMFVVVATFLVPQFVISRMWLVLVWLLSFLLVATNRFGQRRVLYALRRRGYLVSPAVIVGTNQEAISLVKFLSEWQTSGIRTVGFVTTDEGETAEVDLPILGSTREIGAIVREHGIEDLIVAITAIEREELLGLCEDVDSIPVRLRLSSGLYELLTTRVSVQTLGTVPLMSLHKNRLAGGEVAIKGLLDVSIASAALLVLSPLLLLIACLIKLDSPGPLIYRRRVLGVGGKQFDAFKFRTMHVNGDDLLKRHPDAVEELKTNYKLKDDPRITGVGRWLRKYSVDEVPQLFNVLRGQMSLVGPRMITPAEGDKYGRHRMNLLSVKPGITGLWQVSGRSDLSYAERVRIDMYYVRNYSVWLDLQILFVETVPAVLRGRGAY
jgi:exopolysaccharide biosynthesis polyprenyl glycosylphosphotransferase